MQSSTDHLSEIFLALAHPVRREILEKLKTGEASVADLSKNIDVSGPMMTKHLRILQKAKLIKRDQRAQQRYSELNYETLKEIDSWISKYVDLWEDMLDRLEKEYQKKSTDKEERK